MKMRQAYLGYIEDVISVEPDDKHPRDTSKKFWTYIKQKEKDNSTISGLKERGNYIWSLKIWQAY